MDVFLIILAVLCGLVGLVGCVLPVLPGPPIGYLGLLLAYWSGFGDYTPGMLIGWGAATVLVTAADYYLPVYMTRRFGGSRQASIGATIGIIAGLFLLPPLGIVIFPFFGALAGELIHNRRDSAKAFRVAFGSFVAFLFGTGLKLIVCTFMLYYIVRAVFI